MNPNLVTPSAWTLYKYSEVWGAQILLVERVKRREGDEEEEAEMGEKRRRVAKPVAQRREERKCMGEGMTRVG